MLPSSAKNMLTPQAFSSRTYIYIYTHTLLFSLMLFSVIPDYDSRPIMICNVWLPVSIYIFSLSLALSLSLSPPLLLSGGKAQDTQRAKVQVLVLPRIFVDVEVSQGFSFLKMHIHNGNLLLQFRLQFRPNSGIFRPRTVGLLP